MDGEDIPRTELEAELDRERKAEERERRSNRALDLRLTGVETHARSVTSTMNYVLKQQRRDFLVLLFLYLVLDLAFLLHVYRTEIRDASNA